MAQGDALSTHIFGVQLGGYLVESVQEVSGISYNEGVVEVKQTSSSGELIVRKQPGGKNPSEVTIVRGLDQSSAFTNWINETIKNGALNTARQNITIEIMDSTKQVVRRVHLMQGWISNWDGPSLKAGEPNAATETVTITYEEMTIE
jgi:phage tail-like protein